ncbi:GcvH-related protein [Desulfomonile tiedjei]|uniref:Glycine cleavage system H protein (Lipoate-binding) n=1 Tax=Desulfomonile tiedjei (strain ATCC 49306 / DSM 6799 / DCB-1) TaxID=706587 RepID=I4C5E1_DESTA|nr:glycine cleavage system protein H (lipoate-binding) [Desulfomonile tiedjei]AFM24782.1 glycine cleavage system H protein (lipoate-binding) [Desulfomonile tiedjei DSM 6799]
MGVRFENFLGRELVLPDDRSYDPAEGLWIKREDTAKLAVGITEPTVLMGGTVREVELLVEDGSEVSKGETVILVLTSKLKYIAAPASGRLVSPKDLGSLPEKIVKDPYGSTLFYILSEKDEISDLLDASGYASTLKDSDGARNPGGHKGGVSPTCKAVYMAIGEQNITKK